MCFYDFAEVSKIVEARVANKHIKNYELIKYIYTLFQEAIKISDREIFMMYILAKLQYKNIKHRIVESCSVCHFKEMGFNRYILSMPTI